MALLALEQVGFGYPSGFEIGPIDLQVEAGVFCSIIGPNGCGKSTLLRLISRYLTPNSGRVDFLGRPLGSFSTRALARKLAMIPSESHFEFPFPVSEVVSMGRFPHLGRLQRMSREDLETVQQAMSLTGVDSFAERPISTLSSGERQRVVIARALAQQPTLLLLDEPNSHLDIRYQLELFRLLKELTRGGRITVLVVLHDLNMASLFSDQVGLMYQGRIHRFGAPTEVITTESIRETYSARVKIEQSSAGVPLVLFEPEDRESRGIRSTGLFSR